MHRLLERQLRRHLPPAVAADPGLRGFLDAVEAAYTAAEDDRRLVERSLEIASQELLERNAQLAEAKHELELRVEARSAELADAQARYQTLVERLPWVVYVAAADPLGLLKYASPQVVSLLGYRLRDWVDPLFRAAAVHRDDAAAVVDEAVRARAAGDAFRCEYRLRTADGRYLWVRDEAVPLPDSHPDGQVYHGVLFDITERRAAEERLRHDALHDGLTGLPNRALFLDRLERALARARRDPAGRDFAVLFLDLDRFKIVNDSIGHACGDQLLVEFSRRLTRCVRECDSVARLGGDEFTILAERLEAPEDAHALTARIHAALREPFRLQGHEIFTSSSIGVAFVHPAYRTADELLRDADTAMYRAKSLGPSRVQVFDRAMHDQALRVMQLENDLRRAVDREEFEVEYQPIVCLDTGRVEAMEALVRWRHPERGLVSPAEFIERAEETGLITRIGGLVLRDATAAAGAWRRALGDHAPSVSVNLSARQFSQHDLVETVAAALHAARLPAPMLRLEITESAIMQCADTAQILLRQIKSLGVHVDIDDFGTGYSSLGYLHRFPLDKVKIDRAFTQGLGHGGDEIVRAIVTLAHNLRLRVTGEGIETADQARRLRELGCHSGQGYHFARPVPAARTLDALQRWLADPLSPHATRAAG